MVRGAHQQGVLTTQLQGKKKLSRMQKELQKHLVLMEKEKQEEQTRESRRVKRKQVSSGGQGQRLTRLGRNTRRG